MALINLTAGNQAILTMSAANLTHAKPGGGGTVIPTVQDITVNAGTQSVRYSTLDSSASSAFTTVNENEVSLNMLVDETIFFGTGSGTDVLANVGLFKTSIAKTPIFFSVAFGGAASTDQYVTGTGFIGGLAPAASIDAAVWISPMTIIVNGELQNLKLS